MFGVLFDFLLFEKMVQRNCIKFCVKNEIKFDMLTVAFGESTISRTQVQNTSGITGLRKTEKMSMTMHVLVAL